MQANNAKNLVEQENLLELADFLKTVGSNRRVAAGRFSTNLERKNFHSYPHHSGGYFVPRANHESTTKAYQEHLRGLEKSKL
ncbi:MAG: hypothetical protein AAB647_03250 [Patescibacteria group bacterium]